MANEYVANWESQVKKGILSFIVLNVLNERTCYGYELIEKIQRISEFSIAEGTLYPLLERLKKEGLVTSEWVHQDSGLPRKYYTVSKKGKATLETMRVQWIALNASIDKLLRRNA